MESNCNVKLFSVIIPVYNVESYLDECINSVLQQTLKNYEIILVDDGSTDSSGAICDRYSNLYSFIKVIHTTNSGQLHARKSGVNEATGVYCVFLDADDYLEFNALGTLNNAIQNSMCDCVIYGMVRVSEGKKFSVISDVEDEKIIDKRELYRKCLFSFDYNSMCRKAIRTKLLQNIEYEKYYGIRHGEDLIQTLDVFKKCNGVFFIKDILYNYRLNPNSVTQSIQYYNFQVDNTVREYVLDFLKAENVFTQKDFDDYRSYCVFLIVKKITQIALFDISYELKKDLYNNIRNTEYFTGFIRKGSSFYKGINKYSILFFLYKCKMDWLLICVVKLFSKISKLNKKLKKYG